MKKLLLLTCIVGILSANAQVPSYVPTSGLVGWWPFTGNANDESGNGNNGTVNGATLTTDRFGNTNSAYNFDGTSSYITINALNNIQYKPISYSVWINADSLEYIIYPLGGGRVILGRDQSGYYDQGALMVYHYPANGLNNKLGYYIGQSFANCNYTPSLNSWIHIVFTIDAMDSLKYYINGNLIFQQYYPTSGNANIPFKIGAGTEPNINIGRFFWNGKLDDIGIWNRALTDCEIQQLYNASFLSSSQSPTICNGSSVTVGSNTYDSTGVYTDTLTSINGCDSIVITDLLVLQDSTSALSPTICLGTSFTVGDSTYNAAGTYTNIFTASNGCDSIVTTNLTVIDCSGIDDALLSQVSIYPNPATNQISLIVPEKLIGASYQILDYSGRIVHSSLLLAVNSMIDISSIAKGVYIIQIGQQKLSLKLVKE